MNIKTICIVSVLACCLTACTADNTVETSTNVTTSDETLTETVTSAVNETTETSIETFVSTITNTGAEMTETPTETTETFAETTVNTEDTTNNVVTVLSETKDLPVIHHDAGVNEYTQESYDAYDSYDIDSLVENVVYNLATLDNGLKVYGTLSDGAVEHTEYTTNVAQESSKQTVYIQNTDDTFNTYTLDWMVYSGYSYTLADIQLLDIDADAVDEVLFIQQARRIFAQCSATVTVIDQIDNTVHTFDSVVQDKLINDNISVTLDADNAQLNIIVSNATFDYKIDKNLAQYTETPMYGTGNVQCTVTADKVYVYVGVVCGAMPEVPCYVCVQLTYADGDFGFTDPMVLSADECAFLY